MEVERNGGREGEKGKKEGANKKGKNGHLQFWRHSCGTVLH